jgi:hypothetical protein
VAEVFVSIPMTTDETTLADDAVDRLQAQWITWEPNDADLEVVLIEAMSPMAANAAKVAAQMPSAALITLGTELYGLAYSAGAQAHGLVNFTLIDTAGHTIPAGTEVAIDELAFTTDIDVIVAPGLSVANNVAVTANENGTEYNNLSGTASMTSALSFVSDVSITIPTTGGVDAEDDLTYRNRFVSELELQAKTLVTTHDHELMAKSVPGIFRAVAVGNTARTVVVYVVQEDGTAVPAPTKALLVTLYGTFRQVNTVSTVSDATYTTVNVSYSVAARTGYDPVDLLARIDAMLAVLLNPGTYGQIPSTAGGVNTTWENDPVIRRNVIIDAIGNIEGVKYVNSVVITGSAGTVNGTNQKDIIDFTATVSGGTYTLTVDGQTTAAIQWNATAAQVKAALELLSNVDPGDVLVTGGPGPTDMTVEHTGYYAYKARAFSRTSSVTGGGTLVITPSVTAVAGGGDLTMPGVVSLPLVGTIAGRTL